jgi:hypothetical protein
MRLRSGVHWPLEEQADELVKQHLRETVTRPSENDVLTEWKAADRYRHEVYTASGVPDATRRGDYNRVANTGRPDLNAREGTARPRSRGMSQADMDRSHEDRGSDQFGDSR